MFLCYCRYPTSDMYEDIVDGIVSEYPYLLTCGGLPATSARVRVHISIKILRYFTIHCTHNFDSL